MSENTQEGQAGGGGRRTRGGGGAARRAERTAPKLEAARFLIANMQGHGFVETTLCDAQGRELPFDALDYKNFGEAQAALEDLKAHGVPHAAIVGEVLPMGDVHLIFR